MNVCLQLNISRETSKSGASVDELPALAEAVLQLPRLQLRGLMAIPEPSEDLATQRERFNQVYQAFQTLQQAGYPLDTLSMGMSDDLEAAIAEAAPCLAPETKPRT